MPKRVVDRVLREVGSLDGLDIAVLGASYLGGVKETAFSGVFPLVAALRELGARLFVHDPLYSDDELQALDLHVYAKGQHANVVIVQA